MGLYSGIFWGIFGLSSIIGPISTALLLRANIDKVRHRAFEWASCVLLFRLLSITGVNDRESISQRSSKRLRVLEAEVSFSMASDFFCNFLTNRLLIVGLLFLIFLALRPEPTPEPSSDPLDAGCEPSSVEHTNVANTEEKEAVSATPLERPNAPVTAISEADPQELAGTSGALFMRTIRVVRLKPMLLIAPVFWFVALEQGLCATFKELGYE